MNATMKLVKVALRRTHAELPPGVPGGLHIVCPCGNKVHVYDKQNQRVNPDLDGNMTCSHCKQRFHIDGYLMQ